MRSLFRSKSADSIIQAGIRHCSNASHNHNHTGSNNTIHNNITQAVANSSAANSAAIRSPLIQQFHSFSAAMASNSTDSPNSNSSASASAASAAASPTKEFPVLHPSTAVAETEFEFDTSLSHLFSNNRAWAAQMERQYPGFFSRLSNQQTPQYFWIGCSDSRVPASEITGLMPGDVFVHRNVANCLFHNDMNAQSVLQIAVDVLKIPHIIVCGHYGCAGIKFALGNQQIGLADSWIRLIKNVAASNHTELESISDLDERANRLTELNVRAQVENVCHSSTVQNAWARGQRVMVHGFVYGVHDGLLRDLISPPIHSLEQVNKLYVMKPQIKL